MNLVDEAGKKEEDEPEDFEVGDFGDNDDAEYHNHEDGEQVNCVVQRVLCSAKQTS